MGHYLYLCKESTNMWVCVFVWFAIKNRISMDFPPSTAQQISEASRRCNGLRIVYSWVEGSPAEQNAPTSLCNSVNSFSLKTNAEIYSLAMLSSPKRWNLGRPESKIFSSIMGSQLFIPFQYIWGFWDCSRWRYSRGQQTTHLEPLAGCTEVESVSYQDLASWGP